MTDHVTITVNSGTTAGSFNVWVIHFDEFGIPDPNTRFILEYNVSLSRLLTGVTYLLDNPQETSYGVILTNNADSNLGCVTGETQHFFSNIKLQNKFDQHVGNLQMIGASFGSYTFLNLPSQDDGSITYHHINTEVPIVDTANITIKNNESYDMTYSITIDDSDNPSPFMVTGNTLSGETVVVSISGTSLSPNELYEIVVESLYRPSGLTEYSFCFQYNSDPNTGSTIFYGSLSGACDALNVINVEGRGYSTYPGSSSSLAVGQEVFYNWFPIMDRTQMPSGYYLVGPDPFPPSMPDTIIYIHDGVIISHPSCP